MTNQVTHVADVKVGKMKDKSITYPRLRLPREYIELVGKKASIYETSEHQGETTFAIRLNDENRVAAYNQRAERAEASFACAKPCRLLSESLFLKLVVIAMKVAIMSYCKNDIIPFNRFFFLVLSGGASDCRLHEGGETYAEVYDHLASQPERAVAD